MFNPLVDNFSDLNDSEIEKKITELSQKYWQARNPQLQDQIATILEMYKQEIHSRRARQNLKNQEDGENGLDNLINVS